MKEINKMPEGVKENPTDSEKDGSFNLGPDITRVRLGDTEAGIDKRLTFNRGAYSGPLEDDEEAEDILEEIETESTKSSAGKSEKAEPR
jgi:hypothetical protein